MNINVIRKAVQVKPEEMNMYHFATCCGTAGCIAGNCLFQHGMWPKMIEGSLCFEFVPEKVAGDLMGLNVEQANRLFYVEEWPKPFSWEGHVVDDEKKVLTPGTLEYLHRVQQRAEYFIGSGGK